jgi:Ca2+-transporting ATPase
MCSAHDLTWRTSRLAMADTATTISDKSVLDAPWRHPGDEVLAALQTDARAGLTGTEARARLEQYGPNELIAAEPDPAWRRFLAQFKDALVVLLLLATAISAGIWFFERGSTLPYEALAIFAVVLLNATLGFVHETRAEAAVAALRALSADQATVTRDGNKQSVPAAALVPGDIIHIEEGDKIGADARLIECSALQTGEAALTGESLPVSKQTAPIEDDITIGDRANLVFSGTAATYGHGRAVVLATGMRTEFGRIATLLEETRRSRLRCNGSWTKPGRCLGAQSS